MAKIRKGTKTPMEPDMTEDIVEGPRGRSTGQYGSQEMILSNVIIQKVHLSDNLNKAYVHILNSSHYSLKQNNEQEHFSKIKLELHHKHPTISKFIKNEENSEEEDDYIKKAPHKKTERRKKEKNSDKLQAMPSSLSLSNAPHSSQHALARMCVMCFRIFPSHCHPWTTFNADYLIEFTQTSWEKPPYQDIVEGLLNIELLNSTYVPICQSCTCFVKKYSLVVIETNAKCEEEYHSCDKKRKPQSHIKWTRKKRQMVSSKPRHPVHLAVDFILSGGCTLSPCYSVLNHLMESITYKFPSNPILQMKGGLLHSFTQAVLHHICEFQVAPHTYLQFISLLKWLMTGSQRILTDQRMAKKMRRYLCDFPDHEQWWKLQLPPSACRFCHGGEAHPHIINSNENISFCSMLWNPTETLHNLTKEIQKIEESKQMVDHVTTFCYKCCRFSVISYEYDCSLRKTMKLSVTSSPDAYYTRMIYLFGIVTGSKH